MLMAWLARSESRETSRLEPWRNPVETSRLEPWRNPVKTLRIEPWRNVWRDICDDMWEKRFSSIGPLPRGWFGSGRIRIFSWVSPVGVHYASIGVVLSRACPSPSQAVAGWCHDVDVKKDQRLKSPSHKTQGQSQKLGMVFHNWSWNFTLAQ